jgi:S-phase kinase-associated protein 1
MAKQFIKLKSKDGELFEVEEGSRISITKDQKHGQGQNEEYIINLSSTVLAKVFEYCKYHIEDEIASLIIDEVENWDQ